MRKPELAKMIEEITGANDKARLRVMPFPMAMHDRDGSIAR
jgi:hypothetical protein